MSKAKDTSLVGEEIFTTSIAEIESSEPAVRPAAPPKKTQKKEPKEKVQKVANTLKLLPDTWGRLQSLKLHIWNTKGKRVTIGDLVDEAIADLSKKKGAE